MHRFLWILLPFLLAAEESAKKPDYLKNAKKTESRQSLPKPTATPESCEPPSISEMRVASTTQGTAVSSQEKKKKDPGIHGEVRGIGSEAGRATSGTAVIQDKKNGKWAITSSADKSKAKTP